MVSETGLKLMRVQLIEIKLKYIQSISQSHWSRLSIFVIFHDNFQHTHHHPLKLPENEVKLLFYSNIQTADIRSKL